jgi:hypothetical protein
MLKNANFMLKTPVLLMLVYIESMLKTAVTRGGNYENKQHTKQR